MSLAATAYCFDLRLPANEKWLMVCLADYADEWGESVFPSLETLEERTGMSRSTLKRTFARVLERGVLERVAEATPVSPAFYRIVGVPAPQTATMPPKSPSCPAVLRRAVIVTFGATCEYCRRASGSNDFDPDGKPWQIDRIRPGRRGGIYTADNVTLACRACNQRKRAADAPVGTRSLRDRQHAEGVQIDPPPPVTEGVQIEPPVRAHEGVQDEPRGEVTVNPPGVQIEPREGVKLNPDPSLIRITDPSLNGRAGAAPRPAAIFGTQVDLPVLTRLAHDVIDRLGASATMADLADALKYRGRQLRLTLSSPSDVTKALEAALHQRERRRA